VYARTDKADFNGQVVEALESIGGAALFDRLQTAELGWVRQARVSEMYRDLRRFVRDEDERFNELMFPLWMVGAIELWWRAWTGESHDVRTEAGRACAVAAAG
jgi:hypothetical protein